MISKDFVSVVSCFHTIYWWIILKKIGLTYQYFGWILTTLISKEDFVWPVSKYRSFHYGLQLVNCQSAVACPKPLPINILEIQNDSYFKNKNGTFPIYYIICQVWLNVLYNKWRKVRVCVCVYVSIFLLLVQVRFLTNESSVSNLRKRILCVCFFTLE